MGRSAGSKGGMESTRERIARGRGCCREEGTLEEASVRTERIVGILCGESLRVRYRSVTKGSDDSAGFEGCLMLENDLSERISWIINWISWSVVGGGAAVL